MEKLEILYSILKKDREFFSSFKEDFIENFANSAKTVVKLLDISSLRAVAGRLYILLFSFNKNPSKEFRDFVLTVAKSEIDLKPVLSSSFLYLLKNYIDYVINKKADFETIKVFVELLDIYLSVIDSAYLEYTKGLEIEVKKIKNERLLEESEAIFRVFEVFSSEKKEINILDFYQEVPIECKAKITNIYEKDYIVVKYLGCKYKNFYIEGNELYIKLDVLPKVIRAVVEENNITSELAKLKNFEFVNLPQERRKYIRVEPKEDIYIQIVINGEVIKGKIYDISIGGISIYTKEVKNLGKDSKVSLKFELRDLDIENTGTIKYLKKLDENLYKIGIEFYHDEKIEEIVSEYVVRRQFEIIKELRI